MIKKFYGLLAGVLLELLTWNSEESAGVIYVVSQHKGLMERLSPGGGIDLQKDRPVAILKAVQEICEAYWEAAPYFYVDMDPPAAQLGCDLLKLKASALRVMEAAYGDALRTGKGLWHFRSPNSMPEYPRLEDATRRHH